VAASTSNSQTRTTDPVVLEQARQCNQNNNGPACDTVGNYFIGKEPDNAWFAAGYYKAGCKLKNASACSNMGAELYNGDRLPQDRVEAEEWFQKACDLHDKISCRSLARVKAEWEQRMHPQQPKEDENNARQQRKNDCYANERANFQFGQGSDPDNCWLTQ